jgi:hypothetical protein
VLEFIEMGTHKIGTPGYSSIGGVQVETSSGICNTVSATLIIGDYRKPMEAECGDPLKRLMSDMDTFVIANRAKLIHVK